ncbi:NAD(P)H-dependent oxidoreductase [Acetilactobacillus jinshanensis]|uniref:Flavodoxin family protein n=2 Tax=Bacteria TaxID=2 RepID=A0A4P6ZJ52_9LACO|nr:NAD(P)H-dependent oxidoreductase [Acetilactobacillus jinshanensis]QBP17751.1 flavodoxin family protein [Acetilactobacillus jinshanensis]URL60612.1 flavodoxin family protein [uncultured bacterium]
MKTLVIISHPTIKDSYTQSFLHDAQADFNDVTWHPLDILYPDFKINIKHEQQLLMHYDRIIFQFPLFWYSAPALLKKWEDDVLVRKFANAAHGGYLRHKQLGMVITLGVPAKNYQPGAGEHFSLSELLTPYQALAKKAGMQYLSPFIISQFFYKTPPQEAKTLVDYQNYLTNPKPFGLKNKIKWSLDQLKQYAPKDKVKKIVFDSVIKQIQKNQNQLDDLKSQINMIKRKDDQ